MEFPFHISGRHVWQDDFRLGSNTHRVYIWNPPQSFPMGSQAYRHIYPHVPSHVSSNLMNVCRSVGLRTVYTNRVLLLSLPRVRCSSCQASVVHERRKHLVGFERRLQSERRWSVRRWMC